jgi:hypothetical protein
MSTAVNPVNTSKTDGLIVIALAAIIVTLWAVGTALNV